MEHRLFRITAILMIVITGIMCGALFYFPDLHTYAQGWKDEKEEQLQQRSSLLSLMQDNTTKQPQTEEEMLKQLRVQLPEGVALEDVFLSNQYMSQTLVITIPNIGKSYFEEHPIVGGSDHIVDLFYESDGTSGRIDIVLDRVYEPDVTVKDGYLYLGFIPPHEKYEYVVVVDAGHGGGAPGATKKGINEKDIDLQIVCKLKEIVEQSDGKLGVYYTRLDDSNPSFASRVGLANLCDADLFLSVHNNSTASGRMSSISGTQVMYSEGDESGKSQAFAEICLEELTNTLGSRNKGLVEGDEIYIIRNANMPVALAEVGFMTNQQELDKLNSESYQQQTAQALYNAIIRTLEEQHE